MYFIQILTGNIEHILHFHRSFLNTLKTEYLSWNDKITEVGSIFLNYVSHSKSLNDLILTFNYRSIDISTCTSIL